MTDEGNKMTYLITHNYGKCPNQIEGHTDEGTHFYFRGRHNGWSLGFGETVDDAIKNNDYYGNLYGAGWFETDEWEVVFWDIIDKVVKR
jgi:hypothetical protein